MKKIEIVGLISILVVAIAMSGCTAELLTFNNGEISFGYPEGFEDAPSPKSVTYETDYKELDSWTASLSNNTTKKTNKTTNWEVIKFMKNSNGVMIQVAKNPELWSSYEVYIAKKNSIKGKSGEVLESDETDINDNIVSVDKLVYSLNDPNGSGKMVYYEIYFDNNDFSSNRTVYVITVYGLESEMNEIYSVADTIYESLDRQQMVPSKSGE